MFSDDPCGGGAPHGNYPHPDCDKFYQCYGNGESRVIQCPAGTLYDAVNMNCNFDYAVPPENLRCNQ